MTTTTDTPVDTVVRVEDVRALLDGVWESFLGAEEPLLTAALPAHLGGWTAAVSVTGTWRAQITIEVVDPLARLVTAHMLGRDEEPAVEDVRDALGGRWPHVVGSQHDECAVAFGGAPAWG